MSFSCRGKESEGSHDVDVQPVFALASSRFHMPLWHKGIGFLAQVKASLRTNDEPRTKNNFEGVAILTRAIGFLSKCKLLTVNRKGSIRRIIATGKAIEASSELSGTPHHLKSHPQRWRQLPRRCRLTSKSTKQTNPRAGLGEIAKSIEKDDSTCRIVIAECVVRRKA